MSKEAMIKPYLLRQFCMYRKEAKVDVIVLKHLLLQHQRRVIVAVTIRRTFSGSMCDGLIFTMILFVPFQSQLSMLMRCWRCVLLVSLVLLMMVFHGMNSLASSSGKSLGCRVSSLVGRSMLSQFTMSRLSLTTTFTLLAKCLLPV